MKFNSDVFKRKAKCFRTSWSDNHYLTYDEPRRVFIEHLGNKCKVWYWETSKEMQNAITDLNADDWRYIE